VNSKSSIQKSIDLFVRGDLGGPIDYHMYRSFLMLYGNIHSERAKFDEMHVSGIFENLVEKKQLESLKDLFTDILKDVRFVLSLFPKVGEIKAGITSFCYFLIWIN
jgi:hypothetical protein